MGKKGSSSSVQNKSKKSPTTSTHENSPDDLSPSASKSEASTENKSQRIDIKPLGKLPDGFLNEQKFYIQLVVLLVLQLYVHVFHIYLSIMNMSLYFN